MEIKKEAKYYKQLENKFVSCFLCPLNCKIKENQTGICKVRKNIEGKLYTLIYNKYSSLNIDPIEKKPLYHFYPGSVILSLGSIGCNLNCNFCQNYTISQTENLNLTKTMKSEEIIYLTKKTENNLGIAFTYNEPIISIENVLEIAEKNKKEGFKNILITNGFITKQAALDLLPLINAINLDIKSFKENFYRKICKGSLQPVLDFALLAKNYTHLEITNLIIPTLNDKEEEITKLVDWIKKNLGENTPLHFSRYYPQYKSSLPPTPLKTLENFYLLSNNFLNYVYLGNVSAEKFTNTYCPQCKNILIKRNGYYIEKIGLNKNSCKKCGFLISLVLN